MSSTELRDSIVAKINEGRPEGYEYGWWTHEDVICDFTDQVRKVSNEITGQGRWQTFYTAVYSVALNYETPDVKFFAVDYSMGSTEYQDQDDDESVAYPVKPETRVTTVYVKE